MIAAGGWDKIRLGGRDIATLQSDLFLSAFSFFPPLLRVAGHTPAHINFHHFLSPRRNCSFHCHLEEEEEEKKEVILLFAYELQSSATKISLTKADFICQLSSLFLPLYEIYSLRELLQTAFVVFFTLLTLKSFETFFSLPIQP